MKRVGARVVLQLDVHEDTVQESALHLLQSNTFAPDAAGYEAAFEALRATIEGIRGVARAQRRVATRDAT